MEDFGASVAVASHLAELNDHGLLVDNIFVNCNVVQRGERSHTGTMWTAKVSLAQQYSDSRYNRIVTNATCESERERTAIWNISNRVDEIVAHTEI